MNELLNVVLIAGLIIFLFAGLVWYIAVLVFKLKLRGLDEKSQEIKIKAKREAKEEAGCNNG